MLGQTAGSISRRVPEPYLRAEIAAFPLASEEAFEFSMIALQPQLEQKKESQASFGVATLLGRPAAGRPMTHEDKTKALWHACEKRLAPHTGWSLDRLVTARDMGWFGRHPGNEEKNDGKPVPMHDYLIMLGRGHLAPRAGITQIEDTSDVSGRDAADHYRWLTLTIPEDLLTAGLGVDPVPRRVEMEPPLLVRRLLDRGVAEIHQHVGAGMDFTLLWASALAAIATPGVREDALRSPNAPFGDGARMVHWLLAAAVTRSTLAEFIIRGGGDFRVFLRECVGLADGKADTAFSPLKRDALLATLGALADGDYEQLPPFEALRDLYADVHPMALRLHEHPLNSVLDAYQRCDPIAVRLDLHGTNAGERWFLRKALWELRRPGRRVEGDDVFARLFWQTVRVRCQYFRTVAQRPLTGGLQWFIRFYNRLGSLREPLDPIRPEVSYRVAGDGRRIRALELRHKVHDTSIRLGEEVLQFLVSWERVLQENSSSLFEPEMGIIYHFVKERDSHRAWAQGNPAAFWADTHAEPEEERGAGIEHGRYVAYFAQQCRKARALTDFIKAVPSVLWVVRGLDVANDELGVPTWVLVPLFRHVFEASARVSLQEAQNAGPALKLTAHVGEDFRHLLEGMRRIYEQVHYVFSGSVGRLGHALALGVEPRAWAESVSSVLLPAEERLWDLVWEWRLYSAYRVKPEYVAAAPPGRVEILLNEVRALSSRIYGRDSFRVEELAEAHHVLHRLLVPPFTDEPDINGGASVFLEAADAVKRGLCREHVRGHERVGEILKAYLGDESTFLRGQELVDVPVVTEVESLTAVQNALRNGIGRAGIVVEVNPTSNLLIGDMLDLRNHPILRLFPPVPEENAPPPVAIAVGSDDPVTFSTQLLKEYTYLHQAACFAGYPERIVQDWLESIRSTGMDARFTATWNPSAKVMTRNLIRTLRDYLHEPSTTERHWPGGEKDLLSALREFLQ